MRFRNGALVAWSSIVPGVLGVAAALGATAPQGSAGNRALAVALAVVLLGLAARCARAGLVVGGDTVVVRNVFWSRRLCRADVTGLGIEPLVRRRFGRLVVIRRDGERVPAAFAAWRMRTIASRDPVVRARAALQPLAEGGASALPILDRDPGLTPSTVIPVVAPESRLLLGPETAAVTAGLVFPGVVAATVIFARHATRVSNLDEFALPLPHHLTASLILMVLLYLTTAIVTPIALVLLARTGVWPRRLGLRGPALWRDVGPGIGLLLGVWASEFVVLLPLSPILRNHSLTNTQHNSHVPAYFLVYALAVSITTAVNEEVVVNGYLMTRLAQLGWRPGSSLALSLALRTSYHAYYGVALLATVPFGFWATRSFQRHGRLARPIVAHFLNDAILLGVAVLRS